MKIYNLLQIYIQKTNVINENSYIITSNSIKREAAQWQNSQGNYFLKIKNVKRIGTLTTIASVLGTEQLKTTTVHSFHTMYST